MRGARPLGCLWCVVTAACGSSGGSGGAGAGGAPGGSGGAGGEAGGGGGALVCDAPFVTKGPWSLAADETSVRIRWEACSESAQPGIVFSPEGGGPDVEAPSVATPFTLSQTYVAGLALDVPADFAGTYWIHEALATGLTPGTCYSYHLSADPARSGRFCAASPSGTPIRFLAIGDTNPGLGHTDGILEHALPYAPDFTVHGGDLQYYSSFLETWASWFPIMQPLLSQGAFFPAIGNHESEKDGELSDYALRFFGGAGFDGGDTYYRFSNGGVAFFALDTEESIGQGSPQASWLEARLTEAAAAPGHRVSIVFFHRPLVTCGDSGDDPAARAWLEPIFEATKVKLVLQAHMHGYERFDMPNGITYLTTGGGGGLMGQIDENVSRDYCQYRAASGPWFHAMIVDVDAELALQAIGEDGAVLDKATLAMP